MATMVLEKTLARNSYKKGTVILTANDTGTHFLYIKKGIKADQKGRYTSDRKAWQDFVKYCEKMGK